MTATTTRGIRKVVAIVNTGHGDCRTIGYPGHDVASTILNPGRWQLKRRTDLSTWLFV
jgi:hypothetical protein